MTDTELNPFPHIATPPGVVAVSEWCDLEHPADTYRCISGERRGVDRYYVGNSPVGPHYVEAHAIQESGGTVAEPCIRAEIRAWNWNRHEDWATELSPADARVKAAELRALIAELTVLADAFDAAAAEIDQWVADARETEGAR